MISILNRKTSFSPNSKPNQLIVIILASMTVLYGSNAWSSVNMTSDDFASSEPVYFSEIFLPVSATEQRDTLVVGEGLFRKASCYRYSRSSFEIDALHKIIHLLPIAYLQNDLMCLQVVLPFRRKMDFGILRAGDWTIDQPGSALKTVLHVRANSESDPIDQFNE